ncbi:hypothetical protein CMEL01_09541, partial [Colletotrichum melonis]
ERASSFLVSHLQDHTQDHTSYFTTTACTVHSSQVSIHLGAQTRPTAQSPADSFSREHVTLDKVQKFMSTTIGTDFKGVSEERIGGKQRKAPISPRNTSIAMAGLELDGPISSPPRARWRGESKPQ